MVIIIGFGIHPLSGAWEIELIERFRVCLQACSCYFLHDNPSRIAQSRYDIVTNALGQVDGYLTFTQPRTDTPVVVDSVGLTNRYSFWYEFISARPLSSLGPYVSGRWNDDQTESRRFEVFRLPQADNQSKVRFCFTQVGTSSWWYGIDNFGLYSIPTPTLSIARTADKVTLSWGPADAVGFTLQSSATLANPQWAPVSTGIVSNSVTLTIGAANQFFRLVR
jgi:hypothetical protein